MSCLARLTAGLVPDSCRVLKESFRHNRPSPEGCFVTKKTKFTEEQIAFVLRESEFGTAVAKVRRKMGICEATFFNWKKKYGGPSVSELRRLRQLDEENRKLKQLVADLSPDKAMCCRMRFKKALRPAQRKALAGHLQSTYGASVRRSCAMMRLFLTGWYYRHRRPCRMRR